MDSEMGGDSGSIGMEAVSSVFRGEVLIVICRSSWLSF